MIDWDRISGNVPLSDYKKPKLPEPKMHWQCTTCSYANYSTRVFCDRCGSDRPKGDDNGRI